MEQIFHLPPAQVVEETLNYRCQSIAYTYSDPIVFYEYVYDTASLARAEGLRNVMVTAGYINREPLRKLCRVIDASNTDLKGFTDAFYREVCSATLKPVLDALVTFREQGVWLEVTHLVIPTLNDDLSLIRRMAEWMVRELGPDTPLHFSRFRPLYRLRNLPPTPVETLERARAEAMQAGLNYVYIGNVIGHEAESTYCPRDGTMLIQRIGMRIMQNNLSKDGRCPRCGEQIPGVWL